MSAGNTPGETPGDTPGADPSMEDILASIRRILNEDDAPAGAAPAAEASPSAVPPPPPASVTAAGPDTDEDVLVLDEGMLVTPPEAFAAPPVPEAPPAAPAPAPAPFPLPIVPPDPAISPESMGEGLLAPESAAAAASSVSSLMRTLASERGASVYRGGPTIEDVVREEIRPMLKAWLDQQLPPLVERLVRQEIERVAGRAGL